MADSRRGGIEKIAHLFIAGHGASALRARDNSPRHWASPVPPPAGVSGQTSGAPSISPAPQAAAEQSNDAVADVPAEEPASQTIPPAETARASEPPSQESPASDAPAGAAVGPADEPRPEVSPELKAMLARAKVVAVLTGHMGPLAGPAAEACAKGLAREQTRVAMLYGPAEYACLHQFTSGPAGEANGPGGNGTGGQAGSGTPGYHGNGHGTHGRRITRLCDMLLLPDWVFQFDLWPAGRPVLSIALGYGAGSEGLMAAYGALKGLISRFGRPDEVYILPFGCNEQEEAWGGERLIEMCQRFLEIAPKALGEAHPELRVQGGPLQPIAGGVDGVKQLLESIGRVRLAVIQHSREATEAREAAEPPRAGESGDPATLPEASGRAASPETCAAEGSAEATVLVPVERVPRDGQEVLQAMLEHRGIGEGAFFDIWRRKGVAGTIAGSEGLIGATGSSGELLAFALWMCRQAQIGEIDELSSITIAVREPDEWLIEAAEAMPVPVTWLTWHPYQIAERYGLLFTPAEASPDD
jgi:hypothetical protein